VSQLELKPTPAPVLQTDQEEDTPVKVASQNALPSILRIVCDAISANIAKVVPSPFASSACWQDPSDVT